MIPNETRSKKEILQTKTYEVVRNVVLDGGYPVTRCYLQGGSRDERERERLAAVFLEVQLNSGEICWAYNAAG